MKHYINKFLWLTAAVLLLTACSSDNAEEQSPQQPNDNGTKENLWKDLTEQQVYESLEEVASWGTQGFDDIVSDLSSNKNVEAVWNDADVNLVVKMKGSDVISIYPMKVPADPFSGYAASARQLVSMTPAQSTATRATGGRKVAIFNYFSGMGAYSGQNSIMEWMRIDLTNTYGSNGVEYYAYGTGSDGFTKSNLERVIENSADYDAVIIMSHGSYVNDGSASGSGSYLAVSDVWTDDNKYDAGYGKTDNSHEGWFYRIWNYGSTSKTYNKAIPVSSLQTSPNCLLYVGACEAFAKKGILPNSTYIGWDGKNCTAQAHAAIIINKLVREGKSLMDITDETFGQSWSSDTEEDIWKQDPEGGNMVSQLKYPFSNFNYCLHGKPNYYKNALLYFLNQDFRGSVFVRKADFTFSVSMRGITDEKDIPDRIYLWVRPMWQGGTLECIPVERAGFWTKENRFTKDITLRRQGAYNLTASLDKDYQVPIRLQRPVYLVYSSNFKPNAQEITMESGLTILDGTTPVESIVVTKGEERQLLINEEPTRSFTATSARTDIASVSVKENVLTVTGQREGETTVTITDEQNSAVMTQLSVIVGEDSKSRIVIQTAKAVGETITIGIADPQDAWIDWNNNRTLDDGEVVGNYVGLNNFTGSIVSQTITIYGSMSTLDCAGQQLTRLDLSRCYGDLHNLACYNNQLTELDLRTLTALNAVDCEENALTDIQFSTMIYLQRLRCHNNQLTSLDLRNAANLGELYCHGNRLTTLRLPQTAMLTELHCRDNKLTELDVSGNPGLLTLNCVSNQLESINLSNCPKMEVLLCDGNKLTQLNVQNNQQLTCIGCNANDFDADALNTLYRQLPDISGKSKDDLRWNYSYPTMFRMLRAMPNPGYWESDIDIAERKGWILEDLWDYSQARRYNMPRGRVIASGMSK